MIQQINTKPEPIGFLALILHAHVPFFRPLGPDDQREEHWFFEAMSDICLPLIAVIDRLTEEKIDVRLTFSMTPTLLALCANPLMQERYRSYIHHRIQWAEDEQNKLPIHSQFHQLAARYHRRSLELKSLFDRCKGNVVDTFKLYQEQGFLEILTSAATYGYLPLMKTEEAIRAQIATSVYDYTRLFETKPRGIWLSECAFTPAMDRILKPYGIDYWISNSIDASAAGSHPYGGLRGPFKTPHGLSVFPIDSESTNHVWHAQDGYSGDYNYLEYSLSNAKEHAGHFLDNLQNQTEHRLHPTERKPIIVTLCDNQLMKHQWYGGPYWIEMICRKLAEDQHALKLITPKEYLQENSVTEVGNVYESISGCHSSYEQWLNTGCDWIYRHLHQAEERMLEHSNRHEHLRNRPNMSANQLKRALNQAARELMLAQSSDWALMMDRQATADYAIRRMKDHLGCFHHLCDQIDREEIDELFLIDLESKDYCFPKMDYRAYIAAHQASPIRIVPQLQEWKDILEATKDKTNVFMLAWEYPPKHVGGLSRSVHDLSETLASKGEIVHVITTSHYNAPSFEKKNGVYIHRIPIKTSGNTSFYHWTLEMNLAMVDHITCWKEHGGRIDLLHAHDWMVMQTAREIKLSYGIPLIATLHATEWGRNQGNLHTDLQRKIHQIEWQLTYEANLVFVCSEYMRNQVRTIFELPAEKIRVFPNGIRLPVNRKPEMSPPHFLHTQDRVIFCISRLVYEKGVQVLIEAMPIILSQVPQARLVIAGSGPMEQELRKQASWLGDRVWFTGFVDGVYREQLYQAADVCVIPSLYEPFGIVALEAMASLKPVVVSDTGGLAEIIQHGVDGFKALPGHKESLAWHISELLLQPMLGEKMANTAYHTLLQNHDWSRIAKEIQIEYGKLTLSRSESIQV